MTPPTFIVNRQSEIPVQASIVVSVVVLQEGRILLVQEGKEFCRGQWSLPGGRVEQGEGLVDAAVREVCEETGLHVRVTGMTRVLRYVSQYGFHCVRFNFVAEIVNGELAHDGTEILDLRWVSLDEFDAMDDALLRSAPIARAMIGDVRSRAIHPVGIVFDALAS